MANLGVLDDFLRELGRRLEEAIEDYSGDEILLDSVRRSVLSGGKRVRPMILASTYLSFRDELTDDVMSAAVAVELVHTAALIHDDVMDRSGMRRGEPTIRSLYGDDVAITVGDMLLSTAYSHLPKRKLDRTLESLARACFRMGLGQIKELRNSGRIDVTEEELVEIARLKTASLIMASAEIGAILADAEEYLDKISRYGENLGIAFQIVDDILDIAGDERITGKPLGIDTFNGTLTFPIRRALESLEGEDRNSLISELQKPIPNFDRVRELVMRSGAIEDCVKLAESYAEIAKREIEDLDRTGILRKLADKIVHRAR